MAPGDGALRTWTESRVWTMRQSSSRRRLPSAACALTPAPVVLVQEEPAPRAEITMEEAPESEQPAASLQSGLLHIRGQPSDATVYLDG